MIKFGKSVEINITNSQVHGDVIGGDKIVTVNIHPDKLTSEEALFDELRRQGHEARAADSLISELLKDDTFLRKFDAARSAHEEKRIDESIEKALAEYERQGPTPKTIAALESLLDGARKRGELLAVAKIGTLLLQLISNDLTQLERGLKLANDLVGVLREQPDVHRYIALVRAIQARHLFFKYTDGTLQLRTVVAAQAALPVKVPLPKLVEEHRDVLGNWHLADQYMREALDFAVKGGDASLAISVLFQAEHLQEHGYFFQRYALRQDASEQEQRTFRILNLLREMCAKFGSPSEVALVTLNEANFACLRTDFDRAATLAIDAAQKLTKAGQSFLASKAFDVLQRAQQKEPAVPAPTEVDIATLSGADYEAILKEISGRLFKLSGLDRDPAISRLVAMAQKDLNPERVMKFCEHIGLACRTSPLGDSIALPSMGFKSVRCRKFGGEVEGLDLDQTFAFFKEQECDACKERSPRPDDWRWKPVDAMPPKRK